MLPHHHYGTCLPLVSPALLGKKCCKVNVKGQNLHKAAPLTVAGGMFSLSPVWGGPVLLPAHGLASNLVLLKKK